MECDKITPKTVIVALVDVQGNETTAVKRQLTMGEVWAAEELSGVKAGRFDQAKLREFLKEAGKKKYGELSDDEATAIYSSDAWIKGDDASTPAGRRQILFRVVFSLGYKIQGRGAGNLGFGEGLPHIADITPDALADMFNEDNFVKLVEATENLATLSEPELKN